MRKPWYIEIKATKFLYWYSKFTGTHGGAKMAAFYPFIFTTSEIHPNMRPYFINHELIHFAQQLETLFFFNWLWMSIESGYYTGFKNMTLFETYVIHASEQEAYDNMFNLEYLQSRKHFSQFRKYIKNKPVIWTEYLDKKQKIEESI